MDCWEKLKPRLSDEILSALKSQGFTSPVPVQAATIPKFLTNKDVAVQAVTGSGKTLAFVIPIVEILKRRKECWKLGEVRVSLIDDTGALVVLPTRELAVQVAEVFKLFLPDVYTLRLLIGGTDVVMDMELINTKGATVAIATPGRLADLLERKNCLLAAYMKSLEVLVLDEADRLLDLGFAQTINAILEYLPKQRRTGLFSATLTPELTSLVRAGLRNPITISIKSNQEEEQSTPESLNNFYIECNADDKLNELVTFLLKHKSEKIIVFLATCAGVTYFSTIIERLIPKLCILALHGKMRNKRQKLFDHFSKINNGVLLCTDVMARGIDIPDVDWVVQFDPPSSAKSFIHRCGRTARMGRNGSALVFLLPSETSYIQYMDISQKVIMTVLTVDDSFPKESVIDRVLGMLCKERELYDLSVRAYVSFVRFYRKHELQLIFNLKDLDLLGLAKGTFCLMHLPRMPELKTCDTSSFTPHLISVDEIPFKSKSYMKKTKLVKIKKEAIWEARRQQLKNRKDRKDRFKKTNTKTKHKFSNEDLDELAHDARLIKKFRAGKITKEVLNSLLEES